MPNCIHCGEPILPGEESPMRQLHEECAIRVVHGSVAHQMQICSCYRPGSTLGDATSGRSAREQARAAATYYRLMLKRVQARNN